MPHIALNALHPHPDNANRMTPAMAAKLEAHLRASGGEQCPPLIVRPHPDHRDQFQILDGHHRAEALRCLRYEHARCEIWDVDDERASLLLLTLNRLHGNDDPHRRGALLARLIPAITIDDLAKLVPEGAAAIQHLLELNRPSPPLVQPPDLAHMPQAITFFLTGLQRGRLIDRLKAVGPDRSAALVRLLNLNESSVAVSGTE